MLMAWSQPGSFSATLVHTCSSTWALPLDWGIRAPQEGDSSLPLSESKRNSTWLAVSRKTVCELT